MFNIVCESCPKKAKYCIHCQRSLCPDHANTCSDLCWLTPAVDLLSSSSDDETMKRKTSSTTTRRVKKKRKCMRQKHVRGLIAEHGAAKQAVKIAYLAAAAASRAVASTMSELSNAISVPKPSVLRIPGDFTSIGNGCFNLPMTHGIDRVVVPPSIAVISASAFAGLEAREVYVSDGVREIFNEAFSDACIHSVVLPKSLQALGSAAFFHCGNLTTVDLPSGLHYLKTRTFYGCLSLEYAWGASRVFHVGEDCFRDCIALVHADVLGSDGLLIIGREAFFNCVELKRIIISDSVREIEDSAFRTDHYNRRAPKSRQIFVPDHCKVHPFAFDCGAPGWLTMRPHERKSLMTFHLVVQRLARIQLGTMELKIIYGWLRHCKWKLFFHGNKGPFRCVTCYREQDSYSPRPHKCRYHTYTPKIDVQGYDVYKDNIFLA